MDLNEYDVYLVMVEKRPNPEGVYGATVGRITSWPDRADVLTMNFDEDKDEALRVAVVETF